jgi:hypothetical protein
MRVKHSIDILTPPGKLLVKLTFVNQGSTPVWILRELASGTELTAARFDMRDAGGKPVAYTGKMVKRGPLTASDYQQLLPGKVLTNTIDISGAYAFMPGRHNYNIGYTGPVLGDIAQLGALREFGARPVSFIYAAR